jgi:hypothetical protein
VSCKCISTCEWAQVSHAGMGPDCVGWLEGVQEAASTVETEEQNGGPTVGSWWDLWPFVHFDL